MKGKQKQNKERLELWQDRLAKGQAAYDSENEDFSVLHNYYTGKYTEIPAFGEGGKTRKVTVLRNICNEVIEAQVSSAIPMPRVTALRKQDEEKAVIIEEMLRDLIDRLPFEELKDMCERMVPTYGGAFWLCEWDNEKRTQATVGESRVRLLHPKQIVPQPGITENVAAMDWVIVKIPMTKCEIRHRWGIVPDGDESEPTLRSGTEDAALAEDILTVYMGYEKNGRGGISLFVWCLDTALANFDDYQSRRQKRCKKCGASESEALGMEPLGEKTTNGEKPKEVPRGEGAGTDESGRGALVCPFCGSRVWEETDEDFMEFYTSPARSDGSEVFGAKETVVQTGTFDALGGEVMTVDYTPERVPYYKPNVFPIEVQRNISSYGKLLGESDIAKIKTHQDMINLLNWKITEKAVNAGSWRVVPSDCHLEYDTDEGKRYVVDDPSKLSAFKVIDMQLDISQEEALIEHYYQAAREATGLTDSYQGRRDTSAQSGKAKEISAAQAAGRFESKRRMCEAAFAALYEKLFKFELAYADEPREVRVKDGAKVEYKEFNKWDFLEVDEGGTYFWNDMFLFSCDTATPLAQNREAMWAETKENFSAGTFGDPSKPETLVFYWMEMEHLHYPGAATVRAHLEEELRKSEEARMAAEDEAQMQAQMQAMTEENTRMEAAQAADLARRDDAAKEQMAIIERARADAKAAAEGGVQLQMPQAGGSIR